MFDYFADLLRENWYILVPLVLISGVEVRKKETLARIIQVTLRVVGFIAAALIALGVIGMLTR